MIDLFVRPFYLSISSHRHCPSSRWTTSPLQYSCVNDIHQSKNNRSSLEIIQIVQTDDEYLLSYKCSSEDLPLEFNISLH